jgi:exonuclease VII small subunit
MVSAYEAYIAALEEEIKSMETRMADADERARGRMIQAIERSQAELEKAKRKLQEAGR